MGRGIEQAKKKLCKMDDKLRTLHDELSEQQSHGSGAVPMPDLKPLLSLFDCQLLDRSALHILPQHISNDPPSRHFISEVPHMYMHWPPLPSAAFAPATTSYPLTNLPLTLTHPYYVQTHHNVPNVPAHHPAYPYTTLTPMLDYAVGTNHQGSACLGPFDGVGPS